MVLVVWLGCGWGLRLGAWGACVISTRYTKGETEKNGDCIIHRPERHRGVACLFIPL